MENCIAEKALIECKDINQLFDLWEKSHTEDFAYKCENCIFPCRGNRKTNELHNICKSDKYENVRKSFLKDGSLSCDERKYHKILFVGRESHTDFNETDIFWMKEKFNGSDKYHNCIRKIAAAFGAELEECAFMNINKRGGNASCDLTRLKNYSIAYKRFIEEEIRLLAPQSIVILGELPKETKDIFNTQKVPVYLYPKHPCRYTKASLDEFIKNPKLYLINT